MSEPKHGESRNHRVETTSQTREATLDDGSVFEIQAYCRETSIAERYCDQCKEWHEVRGITSTFFCPVCKTLW